MSFSVSIGKADALFLYCLSVTNNEPVIIGDAECGGC